MNKYKLLLLLHWPFILFGVSVWLQILPIHDKLIIPMLKWLGWFYLMCFPILFGLWHQLVTDDKQKESTDKK